MIFFFNYDVNRSICLPNRRQVKLWRTGFLKYTFFSAHVTPSAVLASALLYVIPNFFVCACVREN